MVEVQQRLHNLVGKLAQMGGSIQPDNRPKGDSTRRRSHLSSPCSVHSAKSAAAKQTRIGPRAMARKLLLPRMMVMCARQGRPITGSSSPRRSSRSTCQAWVPTAQLLLLLVWDLGWDLGLEGVVDGGGVVWCAAVRGRGLACKCKSGEEEKF